MPGQRFFRPAGGAGAIRPRTLQQKSEIDLFIIDWELHDFIKSGLTAKVQNSVFHSFSKSWRPPAPRLPEGLSLRSMAAKADSVMGVPSGMDPKIYLRRLHEVSAPPPSTFGLALRCYDLRCGPSGSHFKE